MSARSAARRSGGPDVHPLNRGLPVLTVDEEIYRLTPSLVIATVDKLAQLPWQGYPGTLFGRVSQWCPRHGYRHGDMDARIGCGGHHNRKPDADAVDSQPVVRLRPPDLIIQDELHLIAGALGTTVGLFEAAVDELCTWRLDDHEIGPKIVASTATVKRAAEQTLQLFARNLAIFPPPVLDQGDTFFSRQEPVTPDTPGRRYLGVCAHGVRLEVSGDQAGRDPAAGRRSTCSTPAGKPPIRISHWSATSTPPVSSLACGGTWTTTLPPGYAATVTAAACLTVWRR